MLSELASDLRRIYEGNAWHGPAVLDALDGVTAEQAARRPLADAHSIYEVTHHIAAWMGEVTSRVRGNKPGMPADGDFPSLKTVVDDAAWSDVRALLRRRQAELIEVVSSFDETRLDEPVEPKNKDLDGPVTYRALLSGLAQHSAYHAGQIVVLKRGS
jgi:uncharacterized damage-inducible protein DinB